MPPNILMLPSGRREIGVNLRLIGQIDTVHRGV